MKKFLFFLLCLFLCLVAILLIRDFSLRHDQHLPDPDEQDEATPQDITDNEPTPPLEPVVVDRAGDILASLSTEQKVGQMFLARCPGAGALEDVSTYHLGGYVLFADNVSAHTPDSLRQMIDGFQQAADLPLIIATDEEGGTVNRISSFSQFRGSAFSSPQRLYSDGGMDAIVADTNEKSALLLSLGINVNLAPVADVCQSGDFMYSRSFGQDAQATAQYVSTVVTAMKRAGIGSCLKHFPGYGNNGDTHQQVITDQRSRDSFTNNDFIPFSAGITAGVDMVLVNHNIVPAFDADYPASLSPAVHQLLRDELGFTGLITTDDLVMAGITKAYGADEAAVLAVLAGNDLLLSTEYRVQYQAVLDAVTEGRISMELIDQAARRVIEYKLKAGLIE